MPTLTTCPAPVKDMMSVPSLMHPPALTLSIGGVDFTLKPSNNDGVMSYRYDNQGKICLDLTSFTGSLQVSAVPVTSLPTTTNVNSHITQSKVKDANSSTTTTMVVEEPTSPDVPKDAPEISPGQQRLTFGTKKVERAKPPKAKTTAGPTSNKNSKEACEKKRGIANSTASSNPTVAKKNKTVTSSLPKKTAFARPNPPPPPPPLQHLCQSSYDETSSFTQEAHYADLSQTMDTTSNPSSTSDGAREVQMGGITSGVYPASGPQALEKPKKTSVQEILDRVNSSNDSVATFRNDEDCNSAVESIDSDSTAGFNDAGVSHNDTAGGETILPPLKQDALAGTAPSVDALRQETTTTASIEQDSFTGFPPPFPRWGHTMTKVKGDRILVYGGQSFDNDGSPMILSDVHVYDTEKQSWDKPINCKGEPRQFHSSTFLPERQLLISFGGESLDAAKKNKVFTTDNLRVLDTEIMLWYPPAVSGDAPSGRSGHTATLLPNTNELVVFGGVKGSKWLNSVSVLDTVRWIWSTPKIHGSAPRPRSYHSAVAVKASPDSDWYKLVVFGGNNKTSCFNSVHVLETEGKKWHWSHPSTTGIAPFPRTGHSAVLLEDGKTICIYAGWDPNEDAGEDDSTDPTSGESDNIFKGSYLLNTETWVWSVGPKPVFAGSGSSDRTVDNCGGKRCGHAAVLENGKVLAFGGRTPGERLAGDFQTLSPSEHLVGLDG